MAYTSSKPLRRHEKIQQIVAQKTVVTFSELSEILHCSESTIRSDLKYLEGRGLLRRTLGGAAVLDRTPFLNLNTRLNINREDKELIGTYAIKRFIKPGSVLMLDGGSTNYIICQQLVKMGLSVTAITNSLSNAQILSKASNISLYLSGGHHDYAQSIFFDDTAEHVIRTMRADIFFLSANGINPKFGVTLINGNEVRIKQLMLEYAAKTVLCADHSKIGKTCFKLICESEMISTLITDKNADPAILAQLERLGVEILIADPDYQMEDIADDVAEDDMTKTMEDDGEVAD